MLLKVKNSIKHVKIGVCSLWAQRQRVFKTRGGRTSPHELIMSLCKVLGAPKEILNSQDFLPVYKDIDW